MNTLNRKSFFDTLPSGTTLPTYVTGQYLTNDGTNLSWAANGMGDLLANGTVPLTANWANPGYTISAGNLTATPTLGAEINTGFASWTATAGWTYGSAKWTHSTGTTALADDQSAVFSVGKYYKIVISVTCAGSGGIIASASGITFDQITATNSYTYYFRAEATTRLSIAPSTGWTGSIDSVSIKESTEGQITNGAVTFNGGQITVPYGTPTYPSIVQGLTGMYFSASKLGFKVAGTDVGYFNSGGSLWMVNTAAYIAMRNGLTILYSDASDQLDLRRTTNPQTINAYGTYTSATSYERGFLRSTAAAVEIGSGKGSAGGSARPVNIYVDEGLREQFSTTAGNRTLVGPQAQTTTDGFATVVVTTTAAATATATNLIPAGGVIVLGVTCRNTSAIAGDAGFTGYSIGDGTDADRWGANVSPNINEVSDASDFTITSVPIYPATTSIVLTQVGGSTFTAAGTIRVTVHYITLTAPST